MSPHREPQRTCVGCRVTASKALLVRIVRAPDGSVHVDPDGRNPGRGAYLHPDAACVRRVERSGGLARALRVEPHAVQNASLVQELRASLREPV